MTPAALHLPPTHCLIAFAVFVVLLSLGYVLHEAHIAPRNEGHR